MAVAGHHAVADRPDRGGVRRAGRAAGLLSASAWLPSIFLLLFVWAIYCCYRGFVVGQGRWQIAGALSFWLALLSYEFSVLLLAGLGLFLLCQVALRRWGWYRGR